MATSKKQKPAKQGDMVSTVGKRLGMQYGAPLTPGQKKKADEYIKKDKDFLKKAKSGNASKELKDIIKG